MQRDPRRSVQQDPEREALNKDAPNRSAPKKNSHKIAEPFLFEEEKNNQPYIQSMMSKEPLQQATKMAFVRQNLGDNQSGNIPRARADQQL